jgi:hypothetical protein
MRERFLFKLAGIALVARMEAFADIKAQELLDAEMPHLKISCVPANLIVDQICPG